MTPYREGKPLSTRIAPDRRLQRAVLLVVLGMATGIAMWELGKRSLADDEPTVIEVVPVPAPMMATGSPEAPPVPGPLTTDEIERVVARHRSHLRRVCWDHEDNARPRTARTTVSMIVGARGDVVDVSSTGTDPIVASCIESQVRTWTFPAHGERTGKVELPFVFARE